MLRVREIWNTSIYIEMKLIDKGVSLNRFTEFSLIDKYTQLASLSRLTQVKGVVKTFMRFPLDSPLVISFEAIGAYPYFLKSHAYVT